MPHVSTSSILAELHRNDLLREAQRYRMSRAGGGEPKPRQRVPRRWRPAWLHRSTRPDPCGCLAMP